MPPQRAFLGMIRNIIPAALPKGNRPGEVPNLTRPALTATAGASLRELMDRMGHSSTRAALIYLHGSDARQRAIADGLYRLVQREMRGGNQGRSKRSRKNDRARGGHADKSKSNDPKE